MQAPGYPTDEYVYGGATPFMQAVNSFGSGMALGQNVEAYITALKSFFPKDANGGPGPISVRRMAEPVGTHAVILGEYGFMLLFDELLAHDTQNFQPASDYGQRANQAFIRDFKGTKLLNYIIVQPEDYTRAQQMANHMALNLNFYSGVGALNDASIGLMEGTLFSVDTSVEAARSFIDQRNPHSTPPRMDMGFTLYARTPRPRNDGRFLNVEDATPVAAVGAYTEIWLPHGQEAQIMAGGNIRYAATVHITNMTSALPLPGFVPLLMAIAADVFIEQGRWRQPFQSFQKGKPNLGNLSPDKVDPGKVWFAPNMEDLNTWCFHNMMPRAILAVDVADGQARIPALALYGDDGVDLNSHAYEQIANFFGNIAMDRSQRPFNLMTTTFVGQYGAAAGRFADSRELDFMKLLADGVADPSTRELLQQFVDPAARARKLYELTGGTFRSLYRTKISLPLPALLANIARVIQQRVRIDGQPSNTRIVDTNWIGDWMRTYASNSFSTTKPNRVNDDYPSVNYGI
jgi:hypothetical protein